MQIEPKRLGSGYNPEPAVKNEGWPQITLWLGCSDIIESIFGKYKVETEKRDKPARVKEQIVRERAFKNIRLESEHVAEFDYRPKKCKTVYRMVVVRKNIMIG